MGGETATLLDVDGAGVITHIWVTIASGDPQHLKALVLRAYWDGESTPSVETPIGDFFGLGLGEYFRYQSIPLSVGSDKALNSYFPMPFQRHARITVTNDGAVKVDAFYFNIDYRAYSKPLPPQQLYFHAQYRQANPNVGTTADWKSNGDMNDRKNLNGEGNYIWMEAAGRGHFVGVTMSVLQNQDQWWGEGDDMFFIDGEVAALHQRHRLRRLLPRGVGVCRGLVCIRAVWCSGQRRGAGRQPFFRLSLSFGFAHSVHEVTARDHRARPR